MMAGKYRRVVGFIVGVARIPLSANTDTPIMVKVIAKLSWHVWKSPSQRRNRTHQMEKTIQMVRSVVLPCECLQRAICA